MHQNNVLSYDLKKNDMNEGFKKFVTQGADIVKPILKERFLMDYILGVGDSDEAFKMFCDAFEMDRQKPIQMIILKTDRSATYDELFYIQNTAEGYFGKEHVIWSKTMTGFVLIIVDDSKAADTEGILHHILFVAEECFNSGIMAVYSNVAPMENAPEIFKRLKSCTEYSFYSDDTKVLRETEIKINSECISLTPQYSGIEKAVLSGDEEKASVLMEEFFNELEHCMPTPAVAKTYCLELYVCIIRCCEVEKIDIYMKGIVSIQKGKTFREIKDFIISKAIEIAHANIPKNINIYSSLIKDTLRIIDENIGNEKLSLRWIAGTILYTNVDYLGKIFKKETGMNFSHYVMEKRMEIAKKLIMEGKKDRIYEVAEKVGYGSNSQYFSQVFKKYTGISPLEYKEITRMSMKKTV